MSRSERAAARLSVKAASIQRRTGTTIGTPAGGYVAVDLGMQVRKARVPSTVRALTSPGMQVEVHVSDNDYVIASILTSIPSPTITAVSTASVSMSTNWTASSGAYDYSIGVDDWGAVKNYTRDIATTTRGIAGDLNAVRSVVNANAVEVDSLTAQVNSLRAQVAALCAALAAQGIVATS